MTTIPFEDGRAFKIQKILLKKTEKKLKKELLKSIEAETEFAAYVIRLYGKDEIEIDKTKVEEDFAKTYKNKGLDYRNMSSKFIERMKDKYHRAMSQKFFKTAKCVLGGMSSAIEGHIDDLSYEETVFFRYPYGNRDRYACVVQDAGDRNLLYAVFDHYTHSGVLVLEALAWSPRAWLLRELYPEEYKGYNGLALPLLSAMTSNLEPNSLIVHAAMDDTQGFLRRAARTHQFTVDWLEPTLPSARIDLTDWPNFKDIWRQKSVSNVGDCFVHCTALRCPKCGGLKLR